MKKNEDVSDELDNVKTNDEQSHDEDLKAQMQDKNIAISELKKLIENCKGKVCGNSNKDAKSHKTTKRYMPVEKSSASKKPERRIPTGHRFSNKKTTTVPEKTMNPRSCLGWQLTGRILKIVGLSSRLVLYQMTSDLNRSDSEFKVHSNELSSSILAFKMRHSMRMLAKDTRSQDGKDDKDNDKGSKSRSQSMKEQAYNKQQRERPRPHELNDKSNLIDLMKECHQ
ncbi:hypothetical protein Tco_0054566 [Tanacetum coccineum]